MTATKVGLSMPPFDGIIVTAAASHVPLPLKEQLKPGGRLIIPIGLPYSFQELLVLEKDQNGMFSTRNVLSVSFVPLSRAQIDSDAKDN